MNWPTLAVAAAAALWTIGCSAVSRPGASTTEAGMQVDGLRTEHLVAPVGIDRAKPRFSWTLQSGRRGARQTAYQIVVAERPEQIASGTGVLWDTGKVNSDRTADVTYAGPALRPYAKVLWAVRAWDETGTPSAWSEPAEFSPGAPAGTPWAAEWIGFDAPAIEARREEVSLAGAKWIWAPNTKHGEAPAGTHTFANTVALPADAKVAKAALILTADDLFQLQVNGKPVGDSKGIDAWKTVRVYDVAPQLKAGDNAIAVQVENVTKGFAGLIAKLVVTLEDGRTVERVTGDGWTCDGAASPAQVVGEFGMQPWGEVRARPLLLPPAIRVRKEFELSKPVARAVLSYTALGLADAYLNGARVSEDRFNPGWTDYRKRVYTRSYDVTSQLKQGRNAIGAEVAEGWFAGHVGWNRARDHYGKRIRFSGTLHLEYTDGSVETIHSDPSWKANVSPTLEADFLMGERHDARLEDARWCDAGFDESAWRAVDVGTDEVKPVVEWHPGPPVVAFETFEAVSIKEQKPGTYVLDLGQNFAGHARLKLRGTKPGQTVTLRFAERLSEDGSIYVTNLRNARVTDTYICRGAAEETWEPRFTFHGFQYVEISGLTAPPQKDTVVGVALSSDTPVVGTFDTSDAMLNRLAKNIYYTQRMNFIDIPTDCPQRDERLGWTADAQFYVRAATLFCDVQPFFDKWLVDLVDAQREDGQFPKVAPVIANQDDGGPAWADAGTIVPWELYEVYGDRDLLARQYPSMVQFVDYCVKRSTPDLLPPEKFHSFGDWLSIKADTPHDVIYVAHLARSADLTARAADVLGKSDDAARLHDVARRAKAAFNTAFVASDGRIKGNTQTVYLMAIAFELVEGDKLEAAKRYLVDDIRARGNHLSTGFIGTKELMTTLQRIGHADVAFTLLHNETFPSWGFEIRNGATSIWERWDGWTPEKGFQDPGMNSFAHYSFGAVFRFMVEAIGGIQSDGPGFRKLHLEPEFDPKLTWAKVTYAGPTGPIRSEWKRQGEAIEWTVELPANTTATVLLPAKDAASITEGGKPLAEAAGVIVGAKDGAKVRLNVVSGRYAFVIR